ncbi:efflux RND transporter periplasmic adaptor subunit [Kordiimonas aestuarii]|uniref:efflux RND transporter periplasmic adaptor subunit n=1 Tax=Kordiimonas aestuarii TaxID=1005925 RepID=UPI0021D21D58|nr:efflux RND transporter periplasmic adaptor subunit [Kordiimonas aestuarii]
MSSTKAYLKRHTAVAALLATALIGGVSVYHLDDAYAGEAPQASAPATPEVVVSTIEPEALRQWSEFSGRLTAVDYVEIRPRVGGTIHEVAFEDGDYVNKGDLLFVIDPRPFEAAVARAEAQLASARSQLVLSEAELKRAAELVESSFVSKSAYDKRKNDFDVAQATLTSAEAELTTAKLNLDYAHVTAPVSGVVSRAEITEGNVIEAGVSAPVLTTIVSNDKLYAEFNVDERTYVNAKRQGSKGGKMPVIMSLAGDASVSYEGELYSFDNKLDLRSGTIRARAVFENTDGALTPGMFAEIRLGSPTKEDVLVVSDKAIGTDQDKKFVYTVNDDNVVEYREVKLGRAVSGGRVVLTGLQPGDRVIINGLQRVRPNVTVAARSDDAVVQTASAAQSR